MDLNCIVPESFGQILDECVVQAKNHQRSVTGSHRKDMNASYLRKKKGLGLLKLKLDFPV